MKTHMVKILMLNLRAEHTETKEVDATIEVEEGDYPLFVIERWVDEKYPGWYPLGWNERVL